jgi:SHAQKYF class myb-like DNA-binding protein
MPRHRDDCPPHKLRLRWTPLLHNLFLDALTELGDLATPRIIQKRMNVPGISRRQVSSHLQRYKFLQTTAIEKLEDHKTESMESTFRKKPTVELSQLPITANSAVQASSICAFDFSNCGAASSSCSSMFCPVVPATDTTSSDDSHDESNVLFDYLVQ